MRWRSTPEVALDLTIAAITGVLGLIIVASRFRAGTLNVEPGAAASAQVAGAVALIGRRRMPVVTLAVTLLVSVVFPVVAVLVALHAVGRYVASERVNAAAESIAVVFALTIWVTAAHARTSENQPFFAQPLAAYVLMGIVPWAVGRAERSSVASAGLRAAAADAESRVRSAAAAAAERERLAREMHDIVAHRISLVVLQTNLLETSSTDLRVLDGVRQIRSTGQEALDEMREVLGMLQSPDGADRAPSLTRVHELVADARGVGQPVALTLDIRAEDVSGPVERTIFRIVQEALTNATRHSPGAATQVEVKQVAGDVEVRVANGPPAKEPTGLTTGGHGLTGLRERVALVGGTISAGRTADGGFAVDARMPGRKS